MSAILSIANLPATTSNTEITQRFRDNRGFLSSRVYFNERLSTIIGEVEFINYECADYALRAIQAYPLPSDAYLRMQVEFKDSYLNNPNNSSSNYPPEDHSLYGQNNKNLNGFPQNMPYTNISGIDDINSRASIPRSDSRQYVPSIPQQPYEYPPYSKEYQGTFQESSKIPQGYQPQLKQPLSQPLQPSQPFLPPPVASSMQQFSQPNYEYGMNRQSQLQQQQQPSTLGQSQLIENNPPIFQNKPPSSFQPQNFIQQQSFPAPPQQRPLPPSASSVTTASSSYQDINPYNSSQFSQPASTQYSQPVVQQSAQNYQPPRQQSSSQYRQPGNTPNQQLPSKIHTQPQQQSSSQGSERQDYYSKPISSSSSSAILGQELVRAVVDLHTAEMNDYHDANIATNSLYIDGVPLDSHEREVAHIFRPFPGFQNIRLIRKRTQAGREFYFCFADFEDALSASVALKTLQGYHFDKNDLQGLKIAFANENRMVVKKGETTGNTDRHSDHHRHEESKRHRDYDRDYSPQKYDNKQENQHRNTGNSHNNARGSNYGAGDSNNRSFQHRHY